MALLDGKQLRDQSLSLDKLAGSGLVTFLSAATVSFSAGSFLRTDDTNITVGTDVVNKNYVDAVASGLDPKIPVKVVAATGSIVLSGTGFQIDGYTVSSGDRVLITSQAGPNVATSSNGIYVATSSTWTRAEDSDGTPLNEVSHGNFVFVTDGNTYIHSGWVLTATDATNPNQILVGTNSQLWVQFSEATNIQAGDGLSYNGQILNVNTGTGLTISSDNVVIANTTVTAGNYGTAGSVATFTVNAQGQLVGATSTSISINSGQVNDFSTAVDTVIFDTNNFVDGSTVDFTVLGATGLSAEVRTSSLTASRINAANSPVSGYVLGYTASGQFFWYDPTLTGDITEVIAGGGLTGGGTAGQVTLSVNAGNMLEVVNDVIEFGGTLSRVTVINGGGYDLFFNAIENLVFTASVFDVVASGLINLDAGTGSVQIIGDDQISLVSNSNDISISTNNSFYITTSASQITTTNLEGLVYDTDYSGTFVSYSLVSKGYVDAQVAGLGSGTIAGVTAGNGLSGGGTANYITLDVNLGINSGLTFSGDNIIVDTNIAGNGLAISSGVLSVNTANGLTINGDNVEIADTIAGSGLTFSGGVINVNVNNDSIEITGDTLRLRDTITGDRTFQDSLTVGGNLTVNGTVSYINTENIYIEDNILTLNATFSGSPFLNSGIEVIRGASQAAALLWDESLDLWTAGLSGSTSAIITESGTGLTKSGNTLSLDFVSVTGAGLTQNGSQISTNLTVNGGLTYSGNSISVDVDGTTIQIVNGKLAGAAQGVIGVTAGDGLIGGGTGSYLTLDVLTGTGLTISSDAVAIADTTVAAGNYGTAGSVATFTVNAQGQLVGATSTSINITTGQITNFSTDVDTVIFDSNKFVDGTTIDFTVLGATGVSAEVALGSLTASRINAANSPSNNYVLGYTASGQFYWFDPSSTGDITEVTAGNGLSGGGVFGNVTLDVNTGLGLTISTDDVAMVWGGTATGLTFSSNAISVNVDGTTIAVNNSGQLTVVAGASTPVYDRFTASVTTGDAQLVTGVTLTSTPNDYSRVQVYVNGQLQRLGDGINTLDCYFGSSPKALNALVATDQLYWNGLIAGFDLTTTDVVEIVYES